MSANQSNAFNEKQAVFDQAHTWAQHIDNITWPIISFFIVLNFMVIKTVLSDSDLGERFFKNHFVGFCPQQKLFIFFFVFVLLWLIPALSVLFAMAICEHLKEVMIKTESPNSLKIQDLNNAFRRADCKEVLKQLKYPYGWVIAAFTIFFLSAWIWIFYCFIP